MTLLDAVNTVLPYLGSHVVTSVETANPTVDLILKAIERNRLALITKGWWFNITTVDLPVSVDKRIAVPTYCISIYGVPPQNVEIQGSYLFDVANNTRLFNNAVTLTIVKDTRFEELPVYAQLYLTYTACVEVLLQDYEYNNTLPVVRQMAQEHLRDLEQEDLRKKKRNATLGYARRFKSMGRRIR